MWSHEQHPSEEEVKVDIAHMDGAVKRLWAYYVPAAFIRESNVGNQLATEFSCLDFSLDILIMKYC